MYKFLTVCVLLISPCLAQQLAQQTCDASRRKTYVGPSGAGAIINGIFSIRSPGADGYGCGEPAEDMMQIFEAARWTINNLNNRNFVPGISLGMQAYDDCNSDQAALQAATESYPQYIIPKTYCTEQPPLNLGVLGPLTSPAAIQVSKFLGKFSASVVSPRAGSDALSNKNLFPSFVRTTPSVSEQAAAIVKYLNHIGWKRVVLVYQDDAYGISGREELLKATLTTDICFVQSVSLPMEGSASDYANIISSTNKYDTSACVFFGSNALAQKLIAGLENQPLMGELQWVFSDLSPSTKYTDQQRYVRGSAVIVPGESTIEEFRTYFMGLAGTDPAENPWFKDWYNTSYTYTQNFFVETTIKAVYTFAQALKDAQRNLCFPTSTSGACDALRRMTPTQFHEYVKNVDYTFTNDDGMASLIGKKIQFDFNGNPLSTLYNIYSFNDRDGTFKLREIGTVTGASVTLDNNLHIFYNNARTSTITKPTYPCPAEGCSNCVKPVKNIEFTYIKGDINFLGLASINEIGQSALSCGAVSNIGSQFHFALKYAQTNLKSQFPNILRGIDVGALIVNPCEDGPSTESFLANFLGGRKTFLDESQSVIDPASFKGLIQTSPYSVAKEVTPVTSLFSLTDMGLFTNNELNNNQKYPLYSSARPADDVLNSVLIATLQRFGWKYVQVVYSQDEYFTNRKDHFKTQAALASICVSAEYPFIPNVESLKANLDLLSPQTNVVVLMGNEDEIRSLVLGLGRRGGVSNFVLVGFSWEFTEQSYARYESAIQGSIVIDHDLTLYTGYDQYLGSFDQREIDTDPVLYSWYQALHDCYKEAANPQNYFEPCKATSLTSADDYKQSTLVPVVIDSFYAMANALHKTLVDICGANYNGICTDFRATGSSRKLFENLQNLSFRDGANNNFVIKDGKPLINFKVKGVDGNRVIATYNTETGQLENFNRANLQLPSTLAINSQCSESCLQCQYMYRHQPIIYQPGDFLLGGLFAVSSPGTTGPYQCGNIKVKDGFQFTSAMMYAIQQVNEGAAPVRLQGLKLGALVMDHCGNSARPSSLLSDVYSGLYDSAWMRTDKRFNGLKPSRISSWLTDNTYSTAEAAKLLEPLNIPIVSPAATASSLKEIRTFYRTVQGDDANAITILKLSKTFGFNYLNAVVSANDFGRSGLSTLKATGQQEGVCIVNSFEISTDGNYTDIIAALVASDTQVVALYVSDDELQGLLQAKSRNSEAVNLVFITPTSHTVREAAAAANMLSLQVKNPDIPGYTKYLQEMSVLGYPDNPFYARYYSALMNCNQPGVYQSGLSACSNTMRDITIGTAYKQDTYVLSTINAVYSIVQALDSTLKQFCGTSYNGTCEAFTNHSNVNEIVQQKLATQTFVDPSGDRFQFINRDGNIPFDILRFGPSSYQKVGGSMGASVTLDQTLKSQYSNIKSECSVTCEECLRTGVNFTFVPGDIILGGVFDVHMRSVLPHVCGAINTMHGFQLLEAFHYALDVVNNKEGMFQNKLNGVKLGGVGLDACQSSIRSGYMVSNIHNGLFTLSKSGETLNPKEIDAYIGTYSSDSSMYLSRILNDLKIPQVSYASSSAELKDKLRYPYFYRTVPADDKQARAMAAFLDKYNVRYVQVLYTNDSYGIQGAMMFKEAAAQKRICIAQMVAYREVGLVSNEVSNEVVTDLRQKPLAKTVVVFADTSYINALLQALGRVEGQVYDFKFIGSDTWGFSEEAILGSEKFASGSVTFSMETDDLKVFDEYMSSKLPLNSQGNPWFGEYYERIWNCYLSVPTTQYPGPCPPGARNVVSSSRYVQDAGVLHVINAVFSSAIALDMTLKEICGQGYTTVCENYKNRADRRDVLLRNMERVTFKDLSGMNFTFIDREGNKGYTLYSITSQSVTSGYFYKKIGEYSSDGELTMDKYSITWDSSCERDGACSECPTIRNHGKRYSWTGSTGSTSANNNMVVGVFDIHQQGIDEFRCGNLDLDSGFQQYLAYLYTIKYLGLSANFNTLVLDSCSNSLRVEQDIYNLIFSGRLCNSEFPFAAQTKNIGGFVVSNNQNTESAARVLDPLGYTYVSPSATSIMFNDNTTYSNLVRTVPPNSELIKTIYEILKLLKYGYVSSVVSFDGDQNEAYNTFQSMAREYNVCTGFPSMLAKPLTPFAAEDALRNQMRESDSRVMILFTTWEDTKTILKAAERLGYLDDYLWIFTDTWGHQVPEITFAPGTKFEAIGIDIRRSQVITYDQFVNSIVYDASRETRNSEDIPREWFEEYYQRMHKCRLTDAIIVMTEYTDVCDKTERMTGSSGQHNKYVMNTIAATYTNIKGVQDFLTNTCPGRTLTACLEQGISREEIKKSVLRTQWDINKAMALDPARAYDVQFNKQQFWHPGYDVLWYKSDVNGRPMASDEAIGLYSNGQLRDFDSDDISKRKASCPKDNEEQCNCPVYSQVAAPSASRQVSSQNETTEPRNYYLWVDGKKELDWPVWAVVVAILTSLGILVSIIVFVYLLIAYPVRGGTTALGYITLFGIICVYVLNFAFFFHAGLETCTTRRLLEGIVYAIVMGPLLVKAVDNWFRKEEDFSEDQYRGLTSTCALVMIALGVILIQVIIPVEWLILVWPTASKLHDSDYHDYWWCDPPSEYDVGLVLSLIYVMFLVILTAIFSGLSWDSYRNNYESRWIFIATVCTAGCMFVWMIVSTSAGPTVRDAAVTIGNLVNATALLICIPLRKMIILCTYDKDEDKKDIDNGDLYHNIYSNPSFDPDFYPDQSVKQDSDAGF